MLRPGSARPTHLRTLPGYGPRAQKHGKHNVFAYFLASSQPQICMLTSQESLQKYISRYI